MTSTAGPRPVPVPRRPGGAGVTIVEVMVVLVIVALGILALVAVQTYSSTDVFDTGMHTRALSVGQAQMEVARTAGFALVHPDSGTVDRFAWRSTVDTVATGLSQVRVTVFWTEHGTPRHLQLTSLLSDR